MSWIANAEAGSSVRAKLNDLMIPISSGTITVDVTSVDISLPAGYDDFLIICKNWKLGTSDYLAFLFSADAGGTFPTDLDNYDSFSILCERIVAGTISEANNTPDAAGAVTETAIGTVHPFDFVLRINPGAVSQYGRTTSEIQFRNDSAAHCLQFASVIYQEATGRQNMIRLAPYNNLTSGASQTITAGSYHLFGVPAS